MNSASQSVSRKIAQGKNSLDETVSKASTLGADISQSATDLASSAQKAVKDAAGNARHTTNDLAKETKTFVEDNPVAVGLFAVAAGALTASIFAARNVSSDASVSKAQVSAEPDVTQAKKSTRAKSSPNKIVKKMKPSPKASKTASAGKTSAKTTSATKIANPAKAKRSRIAQSTTSLTGRGSVQTV